jgi:MoxR-like ATPase
MAERLRDYNYPKPDSLERKIPGKDEKDKQGRLIEPYLPSKELVEAVNVAIMLGRPLLIKGEPGSGKTRLARDVAYQLGLLDEHYFEWFVKSTDRARDGLYSYDAVGRLRDAQLAANKQLPAEKMAEIEADDEYYVHYGPLGQAFLLKDSRSVVLIDEIDKADIDFPNDLLLELDEQRFFIEELDRKEKSAVHVPILIVTSNDEKDLPDAFLRRCLFHYIKFPEQQELKAIVQARFTDTPENVVDEVVCLFIKLRDKMVKGQTGKKVSTSELIDWFRVFRHYQVLEDMDRFYQKLLYPGVLLKSWEDYQQYTELMQQTLAERKKEIVEDKNKENTGDG